MKTYKNFSKLSLPLLFILIAFLLSISEKSFSQITQKKEIVKMQISNDGDKTIEKKIIVQKNEDGTTTISRYENGELVEEKIVDGSTNIENFDNFNIQMDLNEDFEKNVIIKRKINDEIETNMEGILQTLEESLQNIDVDIDVDKVMDEIKKNLQDSEFSIYMDEEMDLDMDKLKDELEMTKREIEVMIEDIDIDEIKDKLNETHTVVIKTLKDIQTEEGLEGNDIEITIDEMNKEIPNTSKNVEIKKIIILEKNFVVEDFDQNSPIESKNNLKLEGLEFGSKPENGDFTIKFENSKKAPIKINILDIDGNILYQESIDDKGKIEKSINSGIEMSGTYILNLSQGKKSLSKKLIVK